MLPTWAGRADRLKCFSVIRTVKVATPITTAAIRLPEEWLA
jgi:hypothetical protein